MTKPVMDPLPTGWRARSAEGLRRWWQGSEPTVLGMTPRHAALHYIAIPLLLAFLSGWPQVGRTIAWSKAHALGFWMGMSFGGWWINDAMTRLVAPALRKQGASIGVVLVAGVLLASLPSDLVLRGWVHAYHVLFPALAVDRPLPGLAWDAEKFLKTHLYGFLTWPVINLTLFHLGRVPLFGFVPQTPAPATVEGGANTARNGGFIEKLPAGVRGPVIALRAEQHYLRVYTEQGEALILHRLSDAVRDLGSAGAQVHRSYWVASNAIARLAGSKSAPRLVLRNGLEVPVSRSFRKTAETAGLI